MKAKSLQQKLFWHSVINSTDLQLKKIIKNLIYVSGIWNENHAVTNTQKVNSNTLCMHVCVYSERPVMQLPVCSSTHHTLSHLCTEPQLILMLSMWYGWWKIKSVSFAVLHPSPVLRGTTEGQQNYTPATFCLFTAFLPNAFWYSASINPADLWLTSKESRCRYTACVFENWRTKTKTNPKLLVINRKHIPAMSWFSCWTSSDESLRWCLSKNVRSLAKKENSENR